MSIEAQPKPTNNDDKLIINGSNSSSPSKNRRRRRRNNKNRNKNQTNKQMNKTPEKTQQTKLYSHKTPKKKKSWQKTNTSSKFENIMNEQTSKQSNSYYNNYNQTLTANEADLLEQQMILEAIAASNKLQTEQKQIQNKTKSTDIDNKNDVDDEKHENINIKNIKNITETPINDKELVTNEIDNNLQSLNDEMLAIHLQKVEANKLLRQQKFSEIYDGKYAKVTSSSVHASTIPKSALQFYYDNDLISKSNNEAEENVINDNNDEIFETEIETMSKHDARIWSERHMNRLNEYETGGNLNINMNMGNQCYNSFRNQLDKKGFITYHNYQLQAKDKKR